MNVFDYVVEVLLFLFEIFCRGLWDLFLAMKILVPVKIGKCYF